MGKYDEIKKRGTTGGDDALTPFLVLKDKEGDGFALEVAGVVGEREFVTIPSKNEKYDDSIALHLTEVEAPVGNPLDGDRLVILSHHAQRARTEHVAVGWQVYMRQIGKQPPSRDGGNSWWQYEIATQAPTEAPPASNDLPVNDPRPAASPKAEDDGIPF